VTSTFTDETAALNNRILFPSGRVFLRDYYIFTANSKEQRKVNLKSWHIRVDIRLTPPSGHAEFLLPEEREMAHSNSTELRSSD
jgi:hypothetical protein